MSDQYVVQLEKRGVMYYLIGGTRTLQTDTENKTLTREWTSDISSAHHFDDFLFAKHDLEHTIKIGKLLKVEKPE